MSDTPPISDLDWWRYFLPPGWTIMEVFGRDYATVLSRKNTTMMIYGEMVVEWTDHAVVKDRVRKLNRGPTS